MLNFVVISFLPNIIIFSNFRKEYLQESKHQPKVEVNAKFREMTEDFDFQIENYGILHHGFFHNINIDIRYQYVKGIANGQYPDFLNLEKDIKQFLVNYPNETDYWEILNKELAKMLLAKYPQLATITLKIYVQPDAKVTRPRSSTVTLTRYSR